MIQITGSLLNPHHFEICTYYTLAYILKPIMYTKKYGL